MMTILCSRSNDFMQSYYSPYSMSSSWSIVPLDLLISIRNKLENVDLLSFRSVCSQWHYSSPIPNPCPSYYVQSFDKKKNIFKVYLKNSTTHKHFISLQSSFSSHCFYFGNSNGWLVFKEYHNEILHLFDPISSRKFILPHLNKKLLAYYEKVKPIVHSTNYACFDKVVVTSSIVGGIAAAAIVQIGNRRNLGSISKRFIFYRQGYDDCQRWSLLMENSKEIIDICLAGDDRFFAFDIDHELYMLDERPSLIRLKKIKLWLPKHILEPSSRNRIEFYRLKKSGETDLKVYGRCRRTYRYGKEYICLKINVTKLNGCNNNMEAACDAKWTYFNKAYPFPDFSFIPLFKEHHSKLSVKI